MSRYLSEIAAELEAMNGGDQEAEHARADGLLIEALRRLCEHSPQDVKPDTDRIIDAWYDLDKWYA